MALCVTRASLRLLGRLAAAPPHVAGGARRLCVASAPSRQGAWRTGLLAPAHLALRRAPLCAAAKAEAEDKAPKKKDAAVLVAELPKALLFNGEGVLADAKLAAAGKAATRDGVAELITKALDARVKVAVCSAGNEKAVVGALAGVLGARAKQVRVFTGDGVEGPKPAPFVYLLAANELGVAPEQCVVFEDTADGCRAARAANMRCIVTHNSDTTDEDFVDAEADAVFDGIGAPGHENFSLEDLTVPNGAFWVDDAGLELKGGKGENGNGAKPKKGKKAAKKGDDDSSDSEDDDSE